MPRVTAGRSAWLATCWLWRMLSPRASFRLVLSPVYFASLPTPRSPNSSSSAECDGFTCDARGKCHKRGLAPAVRALLWSHHATYISLICFLHIGSLGSALCRRQHQRSLE